MRDRKGFALAQVSRAAAYNANKSDREGSAYGNIPNDSHGFFEVLNCLACAQRLELRDVVSSAFKWWGQGRRFDHGLLDNPDETERMEESGTGRRA